MLCTSMGSNHFLSLFGLDEPKYWWFELMILLNKTMMCGGLVVLAPGSPLQVLFAILIMLFHLLFVLKLAPYVKHSEDWSAFLSTLGLCLLSLGAYSMMIELDPGPRSNGNNWGCDDCAAVVVHCSGCLHYGFCRRWIVAASMWEKKVDE